MTDSQIIHIPLNAGDAYTEVRFSLSDFVGRGELGAVYRGLAEPGDQVIVVKIPHTEAKNQEAIAEYNILRDIATTLGKADQPVGAIAQGQYDGKTVIVMPFYENHDRLIDRVKLLISQGELLEAERLAVDAALNYAQVMHTIHSIPIPQSCTDRKIKDFYYLSNGSHYILDWNVLRDNVEPFRVTEIKLFGYLWHELFYSSKGSAPFDPFDDYKWQTGQHPQGLISVGIRVLMARAVELDSAPSEQGGQIQELYAALETWKQQIAVNAIPSEERIRTMLRLFPNGTLPDDQVVNAIVKDLEWRLGQPISLAERAQALDTARKAARTGDSVVHEISEAVERQGVNKALELLEKYTSQAENLTNAQRTAYERWYHLLKLLENAGQHLTSGNIKSYQFDSIRQAVLEIGSAFHAPPQC